MLALFETPAGFALFKIKEDATAAGVDGIHKSFTTAENAAKLYVAFAVRGLFFCGCFLLLILPLLHCVRG